MDGERAQSPRENVWAAVSVMVAVFAVVIALIPWIGAYFAWLPGGVAIGMAIAGLITARRLHGQRREMAIVGLIIAILAIVWSFAGWIFILILGAFAEGS